MGSKKFGNRILIVIAAIATVVILAEALLIWNYAPKKPFENIQKEDIAAVYVMTSETKKFAVGEGQWSDLFLRSLREVTLYGRLTQDSFAQYFGSPVMLRLELKNGKSYLIQPSNFMVRINGKVYEANYYGLSTVDSLIGQWWMENAIE